MGFISYNVYCHQPYENYLILHSEELGTFSQQNTSPLFLKPVPPIIRPNGKKKKKSTQDTHSVSRSVTSCTVQRTSSFVVGKTCRTNEDKKHTLYTIQSAVLTGKLCLNRCPSDDSKGCCTEVKWTIPECLAAWPPNVLSHVHQPGKLHQLLLQFLQFTPQFSPCPGGTLARWLD